MFSAAVPQAACMYLSVRVSMFSYCLGTLSNLCWLPSNNEEMLFLKVSSSAKPKWNIMRKYEALFWHECFFSETFLIFVALLQVCRFWQMWPLGNFFFPCSVSDLLFYNERLPSGARRNKLDFHVRKITQTHTDQQRQEGRRKLLFQTPAQNKVSNRLLRAVPSQVFSISKDGESTASPGNWFQHLTTHWVKKCFPIFKKIPVF